MGKVVRYLAIAVLVVVAGICTVVGGQQIKEAVIGAAQLREETGALDVVAAPLPEKNPLADPRAALRRLTVTHQISRRGTNCDITSRWDMTMSADDGLLSLMTTQPNPVTLPHLGGGLFEDPTYSINPSAYDIKASGPTTFEYDRQETMARVRYRETATLAGCPDSVETITHSCPADSDYCLASYDLVVTTSDGITISGYHGRRPTAHHSDAVRFNQVPRGVPIQLVLDRNKPLTEVGTTRSQLLFPLKALSWAVPLVFGPATLLVPWAALILLIRSTGRAKRATTARPHPRLRLTLGLAVVAILVLGTATKAIPDIRLPDMEWLAFLLYDRALADLAVHLAIPTMFVVLPAVARARLARAEGIPVDSRPHQLTTVFAALASAALVSIVGFGVEGWRFASPGDGLLCLGAAVLTLLAGGLIGSLWTGPSSVLTGTAVALSFFVAGCVPMSSVGRLDDLRFLDMALTIQWFPLALVIVKAIAPSRKLGWRKVAVVGLLTVACALPLGLVATASGDLFDGRWPATLYVVLNHADYLASSVLWAANIGLALFVLIRLVDLGRDLGPTFQWRHRALGITLVAVLALPPWPGSFGDLSVAVLVVVAFGLLIPSRRLGRARQLARIGPAVHARLLRMESNRKLLIHRAAEYHRNAGAKLAEGDLDVAKFQQQQDDLDQAAHSSGKEILSGVSLTWAALGSGGGQPPTHNAKRAAAAGGLFAIPALLVDAAGVYGTLYSSFEYNLVGTAAVVVYLSRWLGYAFFFGYFYPMLRGRTPIEKATALTIAVLIPELARVLVSEGSVYIEPAAAADISLDGTLTVMLLRLGQVIVFGLGLGLYWERLSARRASLDWSRVRSLRRARALATPLTAALVAAVTALSTAFVGAVLASTLQPSAPDTSGDRDSVDVTVDQEDPP
jgi:hypothetical protein